MPGVRETPATRTIPRVIPEVGVFDASGHLSQQFDADDAFACQASADEHLVGMEAQKIPVLALRIDDRIKVGLERFERIIGIDDREPGVVKVSVSSGMVHRFGYRDTATVKSTPAPRRVA